MNQPTSIFDTLTPKYEKPTLVEIGELKEIVRGSGSATFDGSGDAPACTTSAGVLDAKDPFCPPF